MGNAKQGQSSRYIGAERIQIGALHQPLPQIAQQRGNARLRQLISRLPARITISDRHPRHIDNVRRQMLALIVGMQRQVLKQREHILPVHQVHIGVMSGMKLRQDGLGKKLGLLFTQSIVIRRNQPVTLRADIRQRHTQKQKIRSQIAAQDLVRFALRHASKITPAALPIGNMQMRIGAAAGFADRQHAVEQGFIRLILLPASFMQSQAHGMDGLQLERIGNRSQRRFAALGFLQIIEARHGDIARHFDAASSQLFESAHGNAVGRANDHVEIAPRHKAALIKQATNTSPPLRHAPVPGLAKASKVNFPSILGQHGQTGLITRQRCRMLAFRPADHGDALKTMHLKEMAKQVFETAIIGDQHPARATMTQTQAKMNAGGERFEPGFSRRGLTANPADINVGAVCRKTLQQASRRGIPTDIQESQQVTILLRASSLHPFPKAARSIETRLRRAADAVGQIGNQRAAIFSKLHVRSFLARHECG